MVSTNEAMSIIREAKGVERGLGASWYTPVTNTTTGNNAMKHVLTIGMPAPNTGWGVDGRNAAVSYLVGGIGVLSVFSAGRDFLKSQEGGAAANKTQRYRAAAATMAAIVSFGLLSPGTYNAPKWMAGDSRPSGPYKAAASNNGTF